MAGKKFQGLQKQEAETLIAELKEMYVRVKEISDKVMAGYGYISKPGEMAEKLNLMRTSISRLRLALEEAISR
ncbi:MAG: hypothetical protein GX422_07115 [Deltaproteobacteria bacterium]|nr:hypothetical protein [Deltaproteobacteria bacterium]